MAELLEDVVVHDFLELVVQGDSQLANEACTSILVIFDQLSQHNQVFGFIAVGQVKDQTIQIVKLDEASGIGVVAAPNSGELFYLCLLNR